MNVIFINFDKSNRRELKFFADSMKYKAYFVNIIDDAIPILNEYHIDVVVLKLLKFTDLNILRHINTYYNNLETIIITDSFIKEIILLIKEIDFSILEAPFRLSELKHYLDTQKFYVPINPSRIIKSTQDCNYIKM